jgi:putative sugar O-methyltransferase
MNILHINTIDNKGGAAKIAWNLRKDLESRGHISTMYVGIKYSNDPDVHVISWRLLQHKLMHLTGSDLHFTNSDEIIKTDVYKNADVIHCHNLHSGFFDLSTMEKMGKEKPIVWTIHDLWPMTAGCTDTGRCAGEKPRRFLLFLWDRRKAILKEKKKIYNNTHLHVVAGSKWMQQHVKNSILKDNKQHLIYHGIDTRSFKPYDKEEARKRLGLPLDKKIVLFVAVGGSKNGTKGWSFVERTIVHYQESEDITFLCIGGTPTEKLKNVIYVDYIEDKTLLARYYSASDVFLYPTLADSFGLVVAEAMACGVPVVTFDTDAIPELVEHKKNGYVTEHKDFSDLLAGLKWVLELNAEAIKKIREESAKKIAEHFSLNRMTDEYVELYESAMKEQRPYDHYHKKINNHMNTTQKIKRKIKNFLFFLKNKKDELDEKLLPKPTKEERAEIEILRREFEKLSSAISSEKMTKVWLDYCNNLQRYVKERDPRNFLNWDIIKFSMFHNAKKEEFSHLRSLTSWPTWKEALKESPVGNPKRYPEMPDTSGNMVHYAYSLSLLSAAFRINPKDTKRIFEFGGGYGGMARLYFNLGFEGAYYIFDLPEFTALQKYYLRSTGLKIQKNSSVLKNVSLIDKPEFLEKNPPENIDIFIGTWSLSETPIDFRNKMLSLVKDPNYYLIAYQKTFRGIDNSQYFKEFEKKHDNYEWRHFPIEHLPGNYYLLGKKINHI